jgi:outer membrane protein OmpA-like peptidoglycan-associated protein
LNINEYALAENWYSRVVREKDASREAHLNYAKALKQLGKYPEAKVQYEMYMGKYGHSVEIQKEITGADSALIWMQKPTYHQIRNEENVNTPLAEFSLVPTAVGIFYAGESNAGKIRKSGMTGNSYLRVYSAERNADNTVSGNKLFDGSFNDARYHVGPAITDRAGDVLYVTRTYDGKETERYHQGDINWRKHNLELKIYRNSGAGWEEEDFPYNDVQKYSLGHAALSEDGQILYYASDMPGGFGGVDIWYSELQSDGSWGKPHNAGTAINTGGDEMFPTIDGQMLYFSSTGHVGMGGLDIFRTTGSKDNFSKPQNMGYPVNSASDDFSFYIEGEAGGKQVGYLSSNRIGGAGSDDIYSFNYERPQITIVLEGITRNKNTGDLLPSSPVTLYGPKGEIIARNITDNDAEVSFTVDPTLEYRLYGEKQGFFPDSLRISGLTGDKDTTIRVTLNLQPVFKKGDRFILENILYDFDKHNIRPDAAAILDKLVATMRDNPTLKIELSSHTDSRGTQTYNERLSQRRAQAAVDYLVKRGIARDRMVAKGYGETRLLNRCADGVSCTAAEHQANRRTEVEVLDI